MHEITVETEFCAAHAISVRGAREPVHGHNFRLRATLGAETLDVDGLVCDFHRVEARLRQIIEPFRDRDLNTTPPFDRINPTAERLAMHIGERLAAAARDDLGPRIRLVSVSVTEAPGCTATYRPDDRPDGFRA